MQVAAFLSDLKSLSVCPEEAAVALVNVHKQANTKRDLDQTAEEDKAVDQDLTRANELMLLHQDVKLKHIESGLDPELLNARSEVRKVLASLQGKT